MEYDNAKRLATEIWNRGGKRPQAVYVQKVDADEWRVSDIWASIRGYVNITTESIQEYGRKEWYPA